MTITPDLLDFRGRRVLVTGAAQGIGEAISRGFAAFGASLAVCDRQAEPLSALCADLRADGTDVLDAVLDVRDGEAVAGWVAGIERVDVLVNNAGGGFWAPFLDVNAKGQKALVDENFTSVTHFVRVCVPKMPAGSSIVNITSIEAYRAAPGFGVYGAMKAAVEHLSRTLALELVDHGIRVNTIAPDAIPTEGELSLGATIGSGEVAESGTYGDVVPLGRGETDDCAGAAVYLASPLAKFLTGTTIHVDGGANAARGWRRVVGAGKAWRP